jgi:formylglycine-generating enzyme required for sulfatase activity
MRRKGVFVVLAVIGMACSLLMMSCKQDAQQPISITQSTGNDGPPKALGIPNKLTLDLGNKVTMKLVLIPAGTFTMGSPKNDKDRSADESPQHEVTISNPFYMGIYTVTQEQYQQVMGENPSEFKGKTNPVEKVSWDDAVEFCKALSKKTGKTVRLPTEAQWEYACRAGTTTPFNTGNTIGTDEANYDGNSVYGKGEFRNKTTPVGSFNANGWGLFDMHGNVYEWCSDWYRDNYYANSPKTDPQGPESGTVYVWNSLFGGCTEHVLRGGAFPMMSACCRSARRDRTDPHNRSSDIGFRVVVLPGSN